MKTAITAGLLFAVLFAAAPLQAKQTALQEARVWFEKAASQNQPDALYQPGVMYYRGKGCERGDCAIARSFYERAAAQSHGSAQFYLAMMYLRGTRRGAGLRKRCGTDESLL